MVKFLERHEQLQSLGRRPLSVEYAFGGDESLSR